MLSMAEQALGQETLLWDDDQSWAFPILCREQENGGGKVSIDVENSDAGGEAPPPAKGRKRRAPAAAAGGGDQDRGGNGGGGGGNDGDGGSETDHDLHIMTERERRKKMRNMFANLHALMPHLPSRADKSTIVDEAVLHIKKLRLTLSNLEKLKAEILKGSSANTTVCDPSILTHHKLPIQSREVFLAEQGSTFTSPVTLAGPNSFSPLFTGPEFPVTFKSWSSANVIVSICGKDAHFNVCCSRKPGPMTALMYVMEKYKLEVVSAHVSAQGNRRMLMVHVTRANYGGQEQFPETLGMVEEIYRQAAGEIMMWINS